MYRTYKFKLDNSKFKITDEGYLICQGACSRTGIQNYPNEKGDGVIREFRPDEEVFSRESMDTHKMIPVTMYHPDDLVDSGTFKNLAVGVTGSSPRKEGNFVINDFKIMDKETVESILAKKDRGKTTEISMGYHCKVMDQKGVFDDEAYDAIQRNIRCNHAALCDQGTARAGGGASLRLDGSEELALFLLDKNDKRKLQTVIISNEIAKNAEAARKIAAKFGDIKKIDTTESSFRFRQMEPGRFKEGTFKTFQVPGKPGVSLVFGTLKERKDSMKTLKKEAINVGEFHMDSIDCEYDDDSESLMNRLSVKLDEAVGVIKKMIGIVTISKTDHDKAIKEAKDEHDKIRAQVDQLNADKEKSDKDLKELSNVNSPRVLEMIQSKARIKTVADYFEVDTEGKSEKDIKIAILGKVSPDYKFDGESDSYINGRFDLIAEKVDSTKTDDKKAMDSLASFTRNSKGNNDDKKDARSIFMENSRNAHKTGTVFPTEQ